MATMIDFAPLFRTGIGFDRMLDALEAANRGQTADKWPPYDIIKMGEDVYRIEMAVAGFAENDLALTQDKNILIVAGTKETSEHEENYLHRGIASRSFERRFELADHVRVESARLGNGLLTIDLAHEIPEELKPRRIDIASSEQPRQKAQRIENSPKPEKVAA